MFDLVALAYADEYRAAEVVAALRRLRTGAFAEIVDAVAVARRTDWTVLLCREVDLSIADDCCLQYWRGLVSSLILAPGLANVRSKLVDYGVDPAFERRLTAALPPGSSVVLAIVPPNVLRKFTAALDSFGGTLCKTPIERACGNERHQATVVAAAAHRRPGQRHP
jgi:uncharacterized membrane protein